MSPTTPRLPPGEVQHPLITGLSNVKTQPKWSFSGRQNPNREINVPGPGSYTTPSSDITSKSKRAPGFAFGSASREIIDKSRVPGPGSYAHRGFVGADGPGFSCTPRRGRGPGGGVGEQPGPGSHNLPNLCGTIGPKYSATPRRTDAKRSGVPGPGAYNHEDQALIEGQAKWSFGTSMRPNITNTTKTPGPGTYNHREHVGSGQHFSMQSRREGLKPQTTPGPGAHGGHFSTFGY